jgi:hypothetical protein
MPLAAPITDPVGLGEENGGPASSGFCLVTCSSVFSPALCHTVISPLIIKTQMN